MTLPFEPRPGDPDADHLNTLLDAMHSGTRAPDAASPEAADLSEAADQLRGLVQHADAPATAYLAEHPLHHRWEDIMSTAFPAGPPIGESRAPSRPSVPVSHRTRSLATPPAGNRLNAWLSAAIVALMLLGTIGGAWWLGPGQGGPSDDGRTRLAAVTQDDATPEAIWPEPLTPEEAPWIAAITPDECTTEPMSYEVYAEAKTTDPGPPERSYDIVEPADLEDAKAAVLTLRGSMACLDAGSIPKSRSHYTSDYIFYSDFTADNAPYREELDRKQQEVMREWTLWAKSTDIYPISVIQGIQPPERALEIWEFAEGVLEGNEEPVVSDQPQLTYYEARFNPEDAVMLNDGRMMVPTRFVYWNEDPWLQEFGMSSEPNLWTSTYILKEENGAWLIDEGPIQICIGECDDVLASSGTPAASPVATPQSATSAPTRITDLLAAVPAEIPGVEERFLPSWTYADIEQRFADLGISTEDAMRDPITVLGSNAFGPLGPITNLFYLADDKEFVDTIGFHPYTVQQVLTAGAVPDSVVLLRGEWNEVALTEAWDASGYTEHMTESGVTVWTLGPNGEIDPTHPIQSRMYQALNNVAILDGGILVYAGTMETLELAIASHSGNVESARDDADIAPLLATLPEDTLSIIAIDQPGSRLFDFEATAQNPNIRPEDLEKIEEPFIESREAVGPMPEYHGAIIGITSGSDGSGEVIVRLGANSEEDAAQIVTIVEWRWENFLSSRSLRPLNTVMELTEATTDGTIVSLTFDPLTNPSAWLDLLNGGDLAPFAVDTEEAEAPGSPSATPEN